MVIDIKILRTKTECCLGRIELNKCYIVLAHVQLAEAEMLCRRSPTVFVSNLLRNANGIK